MNTQMISAWRPWNDVRKECEPERDYRNDLRKEITEGGATSRLLHYMLEHENEPVKLQDAMAYVGRYERTAQLLLETVQSHMPRHIIYELEKDDKRKYGLSTTARTVYVIARSKEAWGL